MWKRILSIAFIFGCTSIAWMVLGGTITARTSATGEHLRGKVQSVWGTAQAQSAPLLEYSETLHHSETVTEEGRTRTVDKTTVEPRSLAPLASKVAVDLHGEPRRKGLLWYATYKVGFHGEYEFQNTTGSAREMRLALHLPAAQAVYDDLQFLVNDKPVTPVINSEAAYAVVNLAGGERVTLRVGYRSQGLDSWKYSFGKDINSVSNFDLAMTTDFHDIDFPDNTLAPTAKHESDTGWQLAWQYKNLLSGYAIAMTMPEKLQPGPLASEISFFAPVSLFFFFFVIFIVTAMRGIDLHPMNYFFLAAAFFAFHLLLAYLADHLDIHASFAISAAVSIFLLVSYLRLVVGIHFAIREAAMAQFIYLVLFSYAFFFQGLTGLSITIGAILTLFVVMQMTGRVRWSELQPRQA
jgi:inner membrane protein involved in colicin E2 resistance